MLQVQSRTTATDGSFIFQRVPGDGEIELVYWAKGVPPGRRIHLEKLPEKERTALLIQAPAPARILGTIDRKVFPKIDFIQLSGVPQFYRPMMSADGKSFVIDGLPAGTHRLEIFSPEKPVQGPGDFSHLGGKSVTLEAGKEIRVSFAEADGARDGSP